METKKSIEPPKELQALVDKLLTGKEEEYRIPLAEARKLGGLLNDLLGSMKDQDAAK